MTTRFIQPGKVLDFTNGASALASGAGVVVGTKFGVALAAIAANATGSVQICGVFSLSKASADAIGQGALVYWNATNNNITTTASGATLAGVAAAAAGAGATSVNVLLNGTPS